jgi:hypothetical protein
MQQHSFGAIPKVPTAVLGGDGLGMLSLTAPGPSALFRAHHSVPPWRNW